MRTNSSDVPSETPKDGGAAILPFGCSITRKTFGHDARPSRQEAAILYNSPVRKFQFPLNQDNPKTKIESWRQDYNEH